MEPLNPSAASLLSWARDCRATKKLLKTASSSELRLVAYWKLIGDEFLRRIPEDWAGVSLRGMKNEVLELLLTRVPPSDGDLREVHDRHLRGFLRKARTDIPLDEFLMVITYVEREILQIILQRLWGIPESEKEDWAYSPMAWKKRLGARPFSDRVRGLIREAVSHAVTPADARESVPYWETLPDDYPDKGLPLQELAFRVFAQFGASSVNGHQLAWMFFEQLPVARKDWEKVVLGIAKRMHDIEVVEHDVYRQVVSVEDAGPQLRVREDVLICGELHATLHEDSALLLSRLPSKKGELLRNEDLALEKGKRYEAVRELKNAFKKVGFDFNDYWELVARTGYMCKSVAPVLWDSAEEL